MSNNRNLGNIATAITNATSGQVLTSQGSGVATFADAGGTGVTVHTNQAAMLTDAASADEGSLHYENANNKLYVKQSSGFFLLASITNTAPTVSGFTETTGSGSASAIADNGTFTLTSGSNTVITLTATDPDLETLVYSATVTSGTASNVISSPSLPISNQSGNTFTLTPVTSGVGGTITIRFDVSDGNNVVNKTHSFSIAFTVVDSKYTTLLATATGTSDNNDIIDSSSNGYSITVNNDAYAGTFSPYRSGGYSVHLDSGEEISFPDSDNYDLSNGSFSIEAWVYPTSYDSPWSGVISQFSSSNRGWGLAFSSTQITFLGSTNGGSSTNVLGSVTSSVPLNQWTHLLVTRSSNTIRIFNNGVLVNNFTETGTFNNSTNPLRIGELNSAASENFIGYLRDIRFLKGSIPTEYQTSSTTNGTTIFSVPSEPLTVVTDTVLLTCHLPYISDGSANDATPTLSGDVSTKTLSPYDYAGYSAADNGGSVFITGSSKLEVTSCDAFSNIGVGDYTLECWHYNSTNDSGDAIDFRNAGGGVALVLNSGALKTYYTGSAAASSANSIVKPYQWNHLVFCRISNVLKAYVNGKEVFTHSDYTVLSGSAGTGYIGSNSGSSYLNGYFSDVRMTNKGVYTGEFTPPASPLSITQSSGTNIAAVSSGECKVLVKGTDASIIDKSQGSNLKLFGTTTGSTDQVRSGNWANTKTMKFDGNSDYITIPNNELYGFGTDDWTIETWLYCTKTGGFNAIFDTRVGTGTETGSFGIGMYNTGRVQLFSGGIFYYPTDTLSFNTWQHFAVVKNSGTTTMYFNGTAASTTYSDSRNYGSSQPVQIGKDDTTSNYFGGYMQDFRITKGLARYTAADETSNIPSAPLEG